MDLKEEIQNYIESQLNKFEMIKTEDILKIVEKRIDSIEYAKGMEYHCCAAVQYTKDKMKEMLK